MSHLKYIIKIKMTIQDIKIDKFPVVILTDTHTNLANIKKLQGLYPSCQFICLGDITSLWSKVGQFNENSIKFFIDNKIPALKGNHEEHIAACQRGGSQYIFRAIPSFGEYDISQESLDFISNLPIGFKLNLPNGKNYLCFHNRPHDLWGFNEPPKTLEAFQKVYPIDKDTLGILSGHLHKPFKKDFTDFNLSFNIVGQLDKFGSYALITEEGIIHKTL
jgi:predicted phosphodiesterase